MDAAAARRQAAACRALAGRGLPVPAPLLTAAGDHLVERADAVYTAASWVSGGSRAGDELTLAEATGLGALLADVHDALSVLPPAPPMVVEPVREVATVDEQLARYATLAARVCGDAMDTFVLAEVSRRRRLLGEVADRRPASGALCGPAGWIHGDFQHIHWASRLSELPLSVWRHRCRRSGLLVLGPTCASAVRRQLEQTPWSAVCQARPATPQVVITELLRRLVPLGHSRSSCLKCWV